MHQQVENSLTQVIEGDQAVALYKTVLETLHRISLALVSPEEGTRFHQLRSVRLYREDFNRCVKLLRESDETQVQLDKLRGELVQAVWYFNNQELSSRALEKQDPEVFSRWFEGAKQEWAAFSSNKSLSLELQINRVI